MTLTPALPVVDIYVDGACSQNGTWKGGWAALLISGSNQKILSGSAEGVTNNVMELVALHEALGALKKPCIVNVYSDSQYVIGSCQIGSAWVPKKNKSLVFSIRNKLEQHQVKFIHIRGHSGHEYNDLVDGIAKEKAGTK